MLRRVERELPAEYRELVERALQARDGQAALALCELPDVIRGYEDIKLGNVERWRERVAELQAQLESGDAAEPARRSVELPITVLR